MIYTRQFVLLCTSSFLFFASFNMIIPELPAFLTSLGGADYKGLIISLFTLTALISRPFSGKLADTIGRIPVIYMGVIMSFVCGLLYPFLLSISGFLFLRFMHGFSTGFTPTGTSAYVADVIPAARRGEALGMLGLISNIGTAIGPALGSELARQFSVNTMFYVASGFALLSMLLLLRLRETLEAKQPFRWQLLQIKSDEIWEPLVFAPSLVMAMCLFAYGVILTVIPDFSQHLGLENKGWFFTFYTLSSLIIRLLAGKLSDVYGRVIVLKWALLTLLLALYWIGFASSGFQLLVGAGIFGLAVGMYSPTLFAWVVDLSPKAAVGRGMATVYMALEFGIGMGAITAGWLYQNNIQNIAPIFLIAMGLGAIALGFLQFGLKYTLLKA
ncbi:MAG: MFS transporter [Microscillaceae bacterium]|jgi:MFS family permease|nr:MFS transporter [Microscillaceae bacterium]